MDYSAILDESTLTIEELEYLIDDLEKELNTIIANATENKAL